MYRHDFHEEGVVTWKVGLQIISTKGVVDNGVAETGIADTFIVDLHTMSWATIYETRSITRRTLVGGDSILSYDSLYETPLELYDTLLYYRYDNAVKISSIHAQPDSTFDCVAYAGGDTPSCMIVADTLCFWNNRLNESFKYSTEKYPAVHPVYREWTCIPGVGPIVMVSHPFSNTLAGGGFREEVLELVSYQSAPDAIITAPDLQTVSSGLVVKLTHKRELLVVTPSNATVQMFAMNGRSLATHTVSGGTSCVGLPVGVSQPILVRVTSKTGVMARVISPE